MTTPTTSTFRVVATRAGKWWAIDVPQIGFTQARWRPGIKRMARDLIAQALDVAPDSFRIEVTTRRPPPLPPRRSEDRTTNSYDFEYPMTPPAICNRCGADVRRRDLHDQWHQQANSITWQIQRTHDYIRARYGDGEIPSEESK